MKRQHVYKTERVCFKVFVSGLAFLGYWRYGWTCFTRTGLDTKIEGSMIAMEWDRIGWDWKGYGVFVFTIPSPETMA